MEPNKMDQRNNQKPGAAALGAKGKGFSLRHLSLQARLTLLVLLVSVPVIVAAIVIMSARTNTMIQENTRKQMEQTNTAIFLKTDQWLTMNLNVLHQLAGYEDLVSMDPVRQKPIMVSTSKVFGTTVHTTNTAGDNITRSDDKENQNFSDRVWFKGAMDGAPVTYQVLVTRTTNQSSLNMSTPIRDASGEIVGVISLVANLNAISEQVLAAATDKSHSQMMTFVVDQTNKVIAHPDPEIAANLTDYSKYTPVAALRQGKKGFHEYTDAQGRAWFAFLTPMENGWAIITQQEAAVALAPMNQFRQISLLIISASSLLLVVMAFLIVRASLRPIVQLTATAAAVTAGDLNQFARVEANDEVGQLAQAFNSMTAQLRENIGGLEQRVAERTRALTLSSEVSRRLSTILDLDQLTREVVNQLKQTFNYYHVHIYLFDEAHENLVMAGGSGEAGQVMLARGHKIPAGKGLVGRAASTMKPVLISNTFNDPDWLPNPLLPDTKSELAVPIAIGDRVLGVLDVQQDEVGELTTTDTDLVQSIANQVAIAVQNARAYAQVRQQAERESLISSISYKIQQSATVDEVLQVAVSELGRALGAQRSSVELRSTHSTDNRDN